MNRIVHPRSGSCFFTILDPGFRGQKGTGSRIRIRNTTTKWCLLSVKGFLGGLQKVERVLDETSPVGARSRDDPLS